MSTKHPRLNPIEDQYLDRLSDILAHGARKEDRTGTGTLSLFGLQLRFPLMRAFPLLPTKQLHLKSIIYELQWFLKGDTNARWLQDRRVSRLTSGHQCAARMPCYS